MKSEYDSLVESAKTLAEIQRQISNEDGPLVISPGWKIVHNAKNHILVLAEKLIRD